MSSWIQVQPSRTKIPSTELYLKMRKVGYCSEFQRFFMAFLYSKHISKPLYLCDTASNLSEVFHLILDTFDIGSNVQYTRKDGVEVFEDTAIELHNYISTLSEETLLQEARALFRWSTPTLKQMQKFFPKEKFVPNFDVGVHIRTGDKVTSGEMKAIPLKTYRAAIEDAQKALGKQKISVYVMTDNSMILPALKKLADPSWTLTSIPLPVQADEGHNQVLYNRRSTKDKMDSYYHFLTELYILQRCPQILCTYSSNVGRFLHLTREPASQIQSLDIPLSSLV